MRTTVWLGLTVLCAGVAHAGMIDEVPRTVWPDEFRDHEITMEQWQELHPRSAAFRVEVLREAAPAVRDGHRGRVAVLVDDGLQGAIEAPLETFTDDLSRDGHGVLVEAIGGGSAADLRDHLGELYDEDLVGAILVGSMPIAWFEIDNDYNEYGYTQFPCDLYFMDLDGSWADADGDGRFDAHGGGSGDTRPEIWIGRLLITGAMGDEVALLTDYFAKNHAYRIGDFATDGSALVYVDDDWSYWTDYYVDELDEAFPDVTSESQMNTTSTADYLPRLSQGYDNVAVYVHSSPEAHFFTKNGQYEWMMYSDVPAPADALFYNLFACSNANFADYVYMAGVYVLNTDFGLVAVGSTKTGSMLEAYPYYWNLSLYEEFGDALLAWWREHAPYGFDEICWHYGITMIGDPTLRTGYPTIGVDPVEISLETAAGDIHEVTIEVDNLGVDALEWTAAEDRDWMSLSPAQGSGHGEITLTLDASTIEGGANHGTVRIDAPGATNNPVEISVELLLPLPPPQQGGDDGGVNLAGCQGCGIAGGAGAPAGLALLLVGLARRRLPNR